MSVCELPSVPSRQPGTGVQQGMEVRRDSPMPGTGAGLWEGFAWLRTEQQMSATLLGAWRYPL